MDPRFKAVLAALAIRLRLLARMAGRFLNKRRKWVFRIGGTLALLAVLPVALLFALPYVLWPFAAKLDTHRDLYTANRPLAFTFLDADGKVAGRRGALVGQRLKLEQMPAYLPAAFVAMEDKRFFEHIGIDAWGILRAMHTNIRARRVVAGGSSISQQTAKIVFTNSERNLTRKLDDMLGALALEKTYGKKQILELYLNRIYLGSGAYGVDGAAHVYFGKSARDLSLSEAAMLATLTTAPSVFSPRRDLARAQRRAGLVLKVMARQGMITPEAAEQAAAHPATISDRTEINARHYFLDTAAEEALRRIAVAGGGKPMGDLIVRTTLRPGIQEAARRAVKKIVLGRAGRKAKIGEAAVVVMTPDGAVAALIGGVDYADSSFNRATQAHRQPGSSFKPFVYLAALESGMTPWDMREDAPVEINGWTPTNFGAYSYSSMTLTDALAYSVNTIAARLGQEVGINAVIEAAQRCGIASKLPPMASLALGTGEVTPLELTAAYAVFASGGYRVQPYFVTEVTDGAGKLLYRQTKPQAERVIASHVMRDLTAMMYAVTTAGSGRRAQIGGYEVAGKTGTTQDFRDAWFVGFSADYAAAVWTGNDDSKPMRYVTGGSFPAQIWREVMQAAEKGLPARPLDRSPPYMPIDEDMMASGLPDDSQSWPDGKAEPDAEQSQPPPKRREQRGFFDWLFGSDRDDDARRGSGGN